MDEFLEASGLPVSLEQPVKKPPRKPRPSEIAAKLAKEAAKKPAVKKTKPKKVVKKKAKAHKPVGQKTARATRRRLLAAAKKPKDAGMRSERLDMRLTKAEKKVVTALAKKKQQTVTSIMIEALGKIR